MTTKEIRLTCDIHGKGEARFVCKHLLRDKGAGFVESPDGDCAWCYECDAAYQEWTLATAEEAGISPVCEGCYGDIRKLRAAS